MNLIAPIPQPSSSKEISTAPSFKSELANLLGVPAHLVGAADVSLQVAYQKYCAYLTASQTLDRMVANKTWTGKKPSKTDIIEIVVSKSFFHSHYKPLFSKVGKYPKMLAWLEEKGDLSNMKVWGVEKMVYTYKDLEFWIKNDGTLKVEIEEKEMDQGNTKGKRGKKNKDDKDKKKKKDKKDKKRSK